jgi:hypothetical protein
MSLWRSLNRPRHDHGDPGDRSPRSLTGQKRPVANPARISRKRPFLCNTVPALAPRIESPTLKSDQGPITATPSENAIGAGALRWMKSCSVGRAITTCVAGAALDGHSATDPHVQSLARSSCSRRRRLATGHGFPRCPRSHRPLVPLTTAETRRNVRCPQTHKRRGLTLFGLSRSCNKGPHHGHEAAEYSDSLGYVGPKAHPVLIAAGFR